MRDAVLLVAQVVTEWCIDTLQQVKGAHDAVYGSPPATQVLDDGPAAGLPGAERLRRRRGNSTDGGPGGSIDGSARGPADGGSGSSTDGGSGSSTDGGPADGGSGSSAYCGPRRGAADPRAHPATGRRHLHLLGRPDLLRRGQ